MSIYVKTPKGIEEVERKAHGLALKPRQMLIMIDGKRDEEALKGIFPPEMVPPIVQELLAGGFIRELEPPKPVATPTPRIDPLIAQKEEMSAALYEVMGPDADNFTTKVDTAKSTAELCQLAAKCEEVVAKIGGRRKAEGFARRVRESGVTFVSLLAAGPLSQTPAAAAVAAGPDLTALKEVMTKALFDAFGPDADQFTGKVDAAKTVTDLDVLARKYAEVVNGMRGRKNADAFLAGLWKAGIDAANPLSVAPGPSAPPRVTVEATLTAPPAVGQPKTDGERLDMARQFMINTTNTFSGVADSSLVVQINQARDFKELRALYFDWREAVALSATGKERLPDLEQRLAALLS